MRKIIFVFFISVVMVSLSHYGCKKSGTGAFILTVINDDGVAGFPDAGTYSYDMNSRVPYDYSLNRLFTNMKVVLDGNEIPLQGSIAMDRDHVLNVGGEKIDFSGKWRIDYVWAYFDCPLSDMGDSEEITIIHTGDSLSITLLLDTVTMKGNIYGEGNFRCLFEETDASGFTMTYTVTGQFVSDNVLEGEFIIFGHFGSSNWHSCWSKAIFNCTRE